MIVDSTYVSKYYMMNPKTDDLLPNGYALKTGMVVLIEDPNLRVDIQAISITDEEGFSRAQMLNRWAEVSDVETGPDSPGLVRFVATYADGTKRKRTHQLVLGWLVKKDSLNLPENKIPDSTEEDSVNMADYAEADAEASLDLLPETTKVLAVTSEQLELVGEAIRDIIPEASFEVRDDVFVLELVVDEEETVKDEPEDHSVHVHTKLDRPGPLVQALNAWGPGPLLGERPQQLREERTVTEHVKVYGPGRNPFYDGRRRY